MKVATRLVGLCLGCAGLCACATDRVYPGYYGAPDGQAPVIAGAPASAPGARLPSGAAGASAAAGSLAGSGSSPAPTGTAGGSAGLAAGAGGIDDAGGDAVGSDGTNVPTDPPADDPCDLSGRWLFTTHLVTEAIGQFQTVHTYSYYEIARQDGGFAITKGLHCGDDGVAEGLFAVSVDMKSSRPAAVGKLSYAGRAVSSMAAAGGCRVALGKWYTVRGATVPHYADPSIPLPTAEQPASGAVPGWEDWDQDGHPGITGAVSGVVAGKIFVAPRSWTELSGTVADTRGGFELPAHWDQETGLLGYEGSELLTSEAVRAADPSLHFGAFARLPPDQAVGDDLAICTAIVALAPTLTPRAAGL